MTQIMRRMSDLHDQLMFPFEQEFDRFFREFWGSPGTLDKLASATGYPKMDVISEGENFIIRAAVPGVSPDNIKVEILDGSVSLSGEMEQEYKSDKGAFYTRELHKSRFSRSIRLPEEVDQTKDPSASFKDGILTLKWARRKSPATPQPKIIPITTT